MKHDGYIHDVFHSSNDGKQKTDVVNAWKHAAFPDGVLAQKEERAHWTTLGAGSMAGSGGMPYPGVGRRVMVPAHEASQDVGDDSVMTFRIKNDSKDS